VNEDASQTLKPTLQHAEEDSNSSDNRDFADVLAVNLERRKLLQGSAALAAASLVASPLVHAAAQWSEGGTELAADKFLPLPLPIRPGFAAIAVNRNDAITVPTGYTARSFLPWGEPLFVGGPAYKDGGLNTGAEQEVQIGMHHDGMHYFPLFARPGRPNRGLIAINHEYADVEYLHANGATTVNGARPADEVRKEIAAHGVSIIEVIERDPGQWEMIQGKYNRRITAATPMELSDPVRGSDLLKTKYSPAGTATRGTVNNCASGATPWGTYLTCEENWAGYHVNKDTARPREHTRYGVPSTASDYRWETVEERFDASTKAADASSDFRNAPNTFGWVVEIDPFDAGSVPVKRTALGRFGHEGAWFAPAKVGRPMTVYMGDDARNEYIYKFVTRDVYVPSPARVRSDALDRGTLYVAKFNDDGTGRWLALNIDDPAFRAAAAAKGVTFKDQADVLVNTRLAADVVGATKMDRPEWGAIDPFSGMVYFTLTNNSARTAEQVTRANPRVRRAIAAGSAPQFLDQIDVFLHRFVARRALELGPGFVLGGAVEIKEPRFRPADIAIRALFIERIELEQSVIVGTFGQVLDVFRGLLELRFQIGHNGLRGEVGTDAGTTGAAGERTLIACAPDAVNANASTLSRCSD